MKKIQMILMLIVLLAAVTSTAIAGNYGPHGPAPNSGDGVSDGSGFDSPFGPNK